ncbi:MAG: barstar family protein, partial [Eubacteriales bacterium]|nr:barstar family protein [Eubacteriales bacterium]
MRKIILDFYKINTKEAAHDYLAEKLGFPEYYGKNLDALYDCLTEIAEPTAIGFFAPIPDMDRVDVEFLLFIDKVKDVFKEAEQDNDCIAVICDTDAEYDIEDDDYDDGFGSGFGD